MLCLWIGGWVHLCVSSSFNSSHCSPQASGQDSGDHCDSSIVEQDGMVSSSARSCSLSVASTIGCRFNTQNQGCHLHHNPAWLISGEPCLLDELRERWLLQIWQRRAPQLTNNMQTVGVTSVDGVNRRKWIPLLPLSSWCWCPVSRDLVSSLFQHTHTCKPSWGGFVENSHCPWSCPILGFTGCAQCCEMFSIWGSQYTRLTNADL